MKAKIIILMILIVLFTIFVTQNTEVVTVKAFFWQIQLSLIVLMTVLGLVGIIVGFIIAGLSTKSTRKKKELTGERKVQEGNKETISKKI